MEPNNLSTQQMAPEEAFASLGLATTLNSQLLAQQSPSEEEQVDGPENSEDALDLTEIPETTDSVPEVAEEPKEEPEKETEKEDDSKIEDAISQIENKFEKKIEDLKKEFKDTSKKSEEGYTTQIKEIRKELKDIING